MHILNGYNTFLENNNAKSIGISATYTFHNEKGSLSYFNLVGDESPESTKGEHLRITNNFVFNYQITQKLKVNMGADYIAQQNSVLTDSTKMAKVLGGIVAIKYQMKPKYAIYGRFDFFSDKDGFLSGTITNTANQLTGLITNEITVGVEYKPTGNSYLRFESSSLMMDSKQKIFRVDGSNSANRLEAMINLGIAF